MSKCAKVMIAVVSLIGAAVVANVICGIFSTRMQKYYRVD